MSHLDLVADHSKEKLTVVPKIVMDMTNLKMLFLEGNFLTRLPDDIFWKLPRLMWLDLRNNVLEYVPRSIAHHEHLENLLLTNNNLQALPNELGLVPKLKALQVSENPLVYPGRKIIVEGTKAIKNYLREQFEILHPKVVPTSEKAKSEDEEERVLSIVETASCDAILEKSDSSSSKESLPEGPEMRRSDPYYLQPPFQVKKLQHPTNVRKKKLEEPLKIVHKVSRNGSNRILLRSSFNRIRDPMRAEGKLRQKSLKEGWLNQLRILLSDQERILQQERNLRALSDWRLKRRTETPKVFPQDVPKLAIPYGTHPDYEKMPTREELAAQLNSFFKEKGIVRATNGRRGGLDIEKLVNDLMQQLREMEGQYDDKKSPRSKMDAAGKQMKTVMDIQKKLLSIKTANDTSI
ncbi:unnamed protein product [Phaedon cochleariae]|uniref:Leucine-rich repeat-containing protein 27 n=1 Tax=Phaedon cochleariae TaxID=80249 RepID=A0A9P0DL41_PHACE|nr:unnamed protein product [Phaedon cochleariae]